MAAVLCTGICKGCTGLCDSFSKICSGSCQCIAKCCGAPCKLVGKVCKSGPFCIYVTVALALNLPQTIMALSSVGQMPCQSTTWMLVNLAFCVANIAAAIYLAISIADPDKASLQDKPTAWGRASHLLCQDPWIALYILVYIGFFVWSIVGSTWSIGGKARDGAKCEDSGVTLLRVSIGLNFAFMIIGFSALCIALCCSCLDTRNLNQPKETNLLSSTQQGYQQQSDTEAPVVNAVPIYEASAPPLDYKR